MTRLAGSPFCDGSVALLAGPTFLHINTRSRRDDQSMREHCCHCKASSWLGQRGQLCSHINARKSFLHINGTLPSEVLLYILSGGTDKAFFLLYSPLLSFPFEMRKHFESWVKFGRCLLPSFFQFCTLLLHCNLSLPLLYFFGREISLGFSLQCWSNDRIHPFLSEYLVTS